MERGMVDERYHPPKQEGLGPCGFTSFLPDASDLLLYLDNFLLVSSAFMIGDLRFKFRNFLGIFPFFKKKDGGDRVFIWWCWLVSWKMQSNNSQYNYRKTYLLNVTSSSFFDLFLPMLKIRNGLKFQWLFALVSFSAWRLALDRDCVLNNSSVRILRFCFFAFRWHSAMISFLFFLFLFAHYWFFFRKITEKVSLFDVG